MKLILDLVKVYITIALQLGLISISFEFFSLLFNLLVLIIISFILRFIMIKLILFLFLSQHRELPLDLLFLQLLLFEHFSIIIVS